jgi:glycosyltransferase involved in cell wall biosynthesis
MRILQITAGAAGMFCGSCTRDNALARELLARGHDVTLVPVYTPTSPDEPNVSRRHVLFGGISVYLQQHSALFRKTPRFLDRVWDAPGVIGAFASRAISTDARMLGDLTISMLEGESGLLRKEFEKLDAWIRDEPLPDVITLPNSLLISLAAPLKRAFNRPVLCTLQGEELFIDALVPPYREQALAMIRRQVPTVDRFIAVSDYCAGFMHRYLQIPESRISVVPLGITLDGYERRQPGHGPFTVGYFARIAPEKGLHLLAEAYVRLRRSTGDAQMRLEAAGTMAPSARAYLDSATKVLAAAGLASEFAYRGSLDRAGKLAFLRGLDLFSAPATYDEPKGMSVLESMATGVPVVQPDRGAFTEIVRRTGGGILVERDDPDSLADGLHRLWSDREVRHDLAQHAFDGVRAHYSVAHAADRLIGVCRSEVTSGRSVNESVA